MSESFYINLEQNLDEIDIMPAGKALAKMMERIDEITDDIGVTRLSDFIGKPISLQSESAMGQEQYDIVLL